MACKDWKAKAKKWVWTSLNREAPMWSRNKTMPDTPLTLQTIQLAWGLYYPLTWEEEWRAVSCSSTKTPSWPEPKLELEPGRLVPSQILRVHIKSVFWDVSFPCKVKGFLQRSFSSTKQVPLHQLEQTETWWYPGAGTFCHPPPTQDNRSHLFRKHCRTTVPSLPLKALLSSLRIL